MKLEKRFPLTRTEKWKYVMPTNEDYEILKRLNSLKN